MDHVLARHAAGQARQAKLHAIGTLHATATAFGVKDATNNFNDFLSRMDTIIAHAGPEQEIDPSQPTREEIAFYEGIERLALANEAKTKS